MTTETRQNGLKAKGISRLTKAQRVLRATRAALKKAGRPSATHVGVLLIGGAQIPCAVLEDGRRVVSQRAVVSMLTGHSKGGLQRYLASSNLSGFIPAKFKNLDFDQSAIVYEREGRKGHGFEAEDIVDICKMYLQARQAKVLLPAQMHLAEKAEIIVLSLAKVGITALIDEATGYQAVRDRDALNALLDKYLRKEYAAWAKRFPDEFYKEIYRLRGWKIPAESENARPGVIGRYTSDIVYDRIAPDLAQELALKNPKNPAGHRSVRHHQWLTEELGIPALQQHIHAVIGLMRASDSWEQFVKLLDRAFPVKTKDMALLEMKSNTAQH